jgi:ribosomal protein S18 acetylase RimI-like enzyme
LQFLTGPGGLAASAFWAMKSVARVEVYGFFARVLHEELAPVPEGMRFIALRREADLAEISADLLRQLDSQSGAGVRALLAGETHVYALAAADGVACQTNISTRALFVDSPIPMNITLRERDTFLAFLYTYPRFRRRGLAETLIRLVCHSLAEQGYARCLCHVRMSNVPSLAAFRRTGWRRVASLVTSTGGKLLAAPGAARTGLQLTPVADRAAVGRA